MGMGGCPSKSDDSRLKPGAPAVNKLGAINFNPGSTLLDLIAKQETHLSRANENNDHSSKGLVVETLAPIKLITPMLANHTLRELDVTSDGLCSLRGIPGPTGSHQGRYPGTPSLW